MFRVARFDFGEKEISRVTLHMERERICEFGLLIFNHVTLSLYLTPNPSPHLNLSHVLLLKLSGDWYAFNARKHTRHSIVLFS